MSTERLIVGNEHSDDYHQQQQHHTMQQHHPTVTVLPRNNSSKQCAAEHEQVFDELPKATIVAVARPDSSDISPMLLSYTIELQYKQVLICCYLYIYQTCKFVNRLCASVCLIMLLLFFFFGMIY